jgi:hypothetical protein
MVRTESIEITCHHENEIKEVDIRPLSRKIPSYHNKKAWEYRAYEFWNKSNGTPKDMANHRKNNKRKGIVGDGRNR